MLLPSRSGGTRMLADIQRLETKLDVSLVAAEA